MIGLRAALADLRVPLRGDLFTGRESQTAIYRLTLLSLPPERGQQEGYERRADCQLPPTGFDVDESLSRASRPGFVGGVLRVSRVR